MFERVTVQPFFPTYVWVHDLQPAITERLNQQLLRDLDEMTAPRPPLPPGNHSWQTENTLHEHEEFAEVVGIMTAATKGVIDELEVAYESFMITGCWANLSPPGVFHIAHTHPNNFLSGVYYVQVPDGADTISFHEPRPQQDILSPNAIRHNKYNSLVHQMKVKPGRLVIFPAWFVHSVGRNESDRLRVSISFNVMFEPFAETISRPKWNGIPLHRKGTSRGGTVT